MKKKLKDLEKRLKNFKNKNSKQFNKNKKNQNFKDLGSFLKIGVELCSSIIVGLVIGIFLDTYFKTKPLFMIIFFLLGSGAGIINVYRTTKKIGFEVGFKKKNGKFFK